MSFTLVSSKCVDLTPVLAKEISDLEPSPTERELDPKRVKHLAAKAKDGLLVTFHWAVASLNGRRLRMNGQHSSAMLCGLNGSFPQGLKAHVDEYLVEKEADLALLFRQFDDRRSSRGPADVAGAYQGLFPEVRNVSKPSAKLAIEGVAYWSRNVEGVPTPSGDEVYQWFNRQDLWPFINLVGEILGIKTPELKKAPIVAAMYATWIVSQEGSNAFWTSVARGGDEYDESAPSKVLDEYLKSIKERQDKQGPKPAELYQGSINAWNAHVQNKQIRTIRTDTSKGWAVPLTP